MSFEHILLDKFGDAARLTINRPQKLNAMAEKTRYEIAAALKALRADKSIRALIITGAGDRAFSAGQDLEECAHACSSRSTAVSIDRDSRKTSQEASGCH
jgi:enoyl-CoA hydratase